MKTENKPLTEDDVCDCPKCRYVDRRSLFELEKKFQCPECRNEERKPRENDYYNQPAGWRPSASTLDYFREHGPGQLKTKTEEKKGGKE